MYHPLKIKLKPKGLTVEAAAGTLPVVKCSCFERTKYDVDFLCIQKALGPNKSRTRKSLEIHIDGNAVNQGLGVV